MPTLKQSGVGIVLELVAAFATRSPVDRISLTATLTVDARWLVRTSLRPRRNRVPIPLLALDRRIVITGRSVTGERIVTTTR